jgi:cobalt/nickel transport protein
MTASAQRPAASPTRRRVSTRTLVLAGLVVSLVVAVVLSLFASASPDGLEHVAETLGFADAAEDSAVAGSPVADYETSGVADEWLSRAVAAVTGLVLTGLVAFGLMRLLARPRSTDRD